MSATRPEPEATSKARVGAAHDPAERQADRIADQLTAPASTGPLRCTACAGDDTPCPACSASARHLRRSADHHAATSMGAAAPTAAVGRALSGTGAPLPDSLRTRFERRLGNVDLSAVRVHSDTDATRAAASVDARAFALGGRIVVAEREFQPHTARGQHLLAHEVAHVLQDGGPALLRREPNNGAPPGPPTLESLVRAQPPGFTDGTLDSAYQRYLRSNKEAADPATWALRQATGAPRARLEQLLGPDYAKGQRNAAAQPPVDVSAPVAPAGYDDARRQQDLASLQAAGGAVTSRLGTLQYSDATGLQLSAGHQRILQGNVGEVLARPLLDQALADVRQSEPAAQLFLGVRAQIRMEDGGWTNPVLFTDGLIGVIEPRGLRVLRIAEIKSGAEGGVQAQEQVHRWIEAHSTGGVRILLPGVARTFEYGERVREVFELARAQRIVIVPSDARFAGERSGHGTTAKIIPMRLAQSSAEIAYLTAETARRQLLDSQARQLAEQVRTQQVQPAVVDDTLALQESTTIVRIQQQNRGLALVNGTLYRVATTAEGRQLSRLPMLPMQAATGPAPAQGTAPPPVATPLPPGNPAQLPPAGAPGAAPGVAPGPLQVPGIPGSTQVAPGTSIPTNVLNFSGQPITVGGGRVVPPSEPVELRVGDVVVRGATGGVVAYDAATGRPIAAVLEGGRLYAVAPAGRLITVDAAGRAVVETTPQLVPISSEPVPGGTAPAARTASPAMRGAAAGLAIFVVINDILGPIGRNLQQQRRNIAVGRAQIDFWAQFGGNPTHAVWSIVDGRAAPGTEADTEAFGSGSYPYVRAIDTASFARTLPTMITTHRDFLLFMDMAKVLGTIVEEPTMPAFPSTAERQEPRRYYAPVDAPNRDLRQRIDVTDIIAPLGERLLGNLDASMRAQLAGLPEAQRKNIFRLKDGSETPLFRSASGGQPILSDEQLLGNDPWVRPLGTEREGGAWRWFRYGQSKDRVLVAPANADAQRAAEVSAYVIKKTPDEVLEEVQAGNRPIISRSPPEGEGDVVSFVAGPEPGDSRFGETRYYRHPNWPEVRWTAAIGELHRFWVNAGDLKPVDVDDVDKYAAAPAPAPK